MECQLQELAPCKRKLSVSVPNEEIKAKLDEQIDELSQTVFVHGFRQGHAPKALVFKHYKTEIEEDVRQELIGKSFEEALEKNSLKMIGRPTIENVQFDPAKELTFDVTFEIRPTFDLPDYKGLKLEKPSTAVSDEAVEEALTGIRRRRSRMTDVEDGKVETDDFVTCDLKIADKEGNELFAEENSLVCANGDYVGPHIIDGAGKLFVGKAKGATVKGNINTGERFRVAEHQKKAAVLTADIKGIRRPVMPEADDAFAKELGADSLDDLKATLSKDLAAENEFAARQAMMKQAEDGLLSQVSFDLPEDVIKSVADDMVYREQLNRQLQGLKPKEETDEEKQAHQAETLDQVRRQFRLDLILDKIAEKEKIFATEEDVVARVAELAQRYNITPDQMVERLEKGEHIEQLRTQIRVNKTMDLLLEKADIKEKNK